LKGDAAQRQREKKASQSKLSEMLRSEEMKQWLRSRMVEPGVLDMSVSMHLLISSIMLIEIVTTN
jgi:hypothetical protein